MYNAFLKISDTVQTLNMYIVSENKQVLLCDILYIHFRLNKETGPVTGV